MGIRREASWRRSRLSLRPTQIPEEPKIYLDYRLRSERLDFERARFRRRCERELAAKQPTKATQPGTAEGEETPAFDDPATA